LIEVAPSSSIATSGRTMHGNAVPSLLSRSISISFDERYRM
jgi:hypothetical protein